MQAMPEYLRVYVRDVGHLGVCRLCWLHARALARLYGRPQSKLIMKNNQHWEVLNISQGRFAS